MAQQLWLQVSEHMSTGMDDGLWLSLGKEVAKQLFKQQQEQQQRAMQARAGTTISAFPLSGVKKSGEKQNKKVERVDTV